MTQLCTTNGIFCHGLCELIYEVEAVVAINFIWCFSSCVCSVIRAVTLTGLIITERNRPNPPKVQLPVEGSYT